ncbi:MAG: class I SAM-dependent methyltransferase [bacterium]
MCKKLPDDFLKEILALEASYLEYDEPIKQSGFGGDAARWRIEREPILDAIYSDGNILDVGCANGYLLECLVRWAKDRAIRLVPYGVDIGAKLIAIAKKRMPEYAENLYVGNAWEWKPPRQFKYVYALYDCVPVQYLAEYIVKLLDQAAEPNGRLIIGAYGSKSKNIPPFDISKFLLEAKFSLVGTSHGGEPPTSKFAWIDRKPQL